MTIAKLEYDISDPIEENDYKMAVSGRDLHMAIWEFVNHDVRDIRKYQNLTTEEYELLDKLMDILNARLEDNNVNLDLIY